MCRIVRTPSFSRHIFTPDELSGWAGYCQYEVIPKREKRSKTKRRSPIPEEVPTDVRRIVNGGYEAQEVV